MKKRKSSEKLTQIFLYAILITSVLPLVLSGELANIIIVLFGGSLFLSWYFPRILSDKKNRKIVNLILILLLAFFVFDAFRTGAFLVNSIYFVMIVTMFKLFEQGRLADYYQLTALSFLLLIGSAIVNPDIYFGIIFLFYIIFLSWNLILLHFKKYDIPKLPVGKKFFFLTSVLALVLFTLSLGFFFLFPRIGLGFFFARVRSPKAITGFSNRIILGNFGTIKKDKTLIMRVKFSDPGFRPGFIRVKGLSFDYYDGRSWIKSKNLSKRYRLKFYVNYGYMVYRFIKKASRFKQFEYKVYLEPQGFRFNVLFTIPRPMFVYQENQKLEALRGGALKFFQDYALDLFFSTKDKSGVVYKVTSFTVPLSVIPKNTKKYDKKFWVYKYYTRLYPEFNHEIYKLARKIKGNLKNPVEISRAIISYLHKNYSYTTTEVHKGEDPISDFLFHNKKGHCEYFATSMALMLRSLGIPARVVNGFYSGTYNEIGGYYMVLNEDAHSWVEVFIPDFGWTTFDPTPSEAFSKDVISGVGKFEQFLDYVEYKWYEWVVEYNLEKQLKLLGSISNTFNFRFTSWGLKRFEENLKDLVLRFLIILLAILIVIYVFKIYKKQKNSPAYNEVQKLYFKLIKLASRHGIEFKNFYTPLEFILMVKKKFPETAPYCDEFLNVFMKVEYGEMYDKSDVLTLKNSLKSIKSILNSK